MLFKKENNNNAFVWFMVMIIAIIVFTLRALQGFIYTVGKHIWKRDYSLNKQLTPMFRAVALGFDGIANACAGEMMNDKYLKQKGEKPYGKWNETISAITGENVIRNNLTSKGKVFRARLDQTFSYFGETGSHVMNCIKK